ncbi:hypothetical protein [Marinobacter sp. VGCF2001]|uniref:hypothetical protein n=1 Tax=Marinobacter sp. VGCF2001 TaxID=3417189 RepID=UPI003CEEE81A
MASSVSKRVSALVAGLTVISLGCLGTAVYAAPSIGSVVAERVSDDVFRVRVQGAGFTEKTDGNPVLYDHVDVTWENGKPNFHQSQFKDGQVVQRQDLDPNTIWAKPSLPNDDNTGMLVVKSKAHRTSNGVAHYFGKGGDNYLGWPMASGGETINYSSRSMYASFWIKLPYDMARYYAIPGSRESYRFIDGGDGSYGEGIKISGLDGTGKIIRYKSDLGNQEYGWLFFEPPEGVSTHDMLGQQIVGLESGASTIFPSSPSNNKFDDFGYIPPRGKYARFWSDSSGKGYGFALGNISWAGHGLSLWSNEYGSVSAEPGRWNLVEVEISLGNSEGTIPPRLAVYMNGQTFVRSDDKWEQEILNVNFDDSSGLTIALLGINDFMSVPFSVEVDDIYLDKSLHRVKICNVSDYTLYRQGKGTCEVQRTTRWTDTEVVFEKYLGALDGNDNYYIYIFDKLGHFNQKGVLIGAKNVPPSPIESIEIN